MLYVSLLPASILLVLAHVAARRPPRPVRWTPFLAGGLPVTFMFGCAGFFSPAVLFVFVALTVALGVWAVRRHRHRRFWPLSTSAVGAAYLAAVLLLVVPDARETARLRQEFPFESMADRVPTPPAGTPLPATAALSLEDLDGEARVQARGGWLRDQHLIRLHERTTNEFVNAPGFGVGRMAVGRPSRRTLGQEGRDGTPDQPGPRGTSAGDADPAEAGEVVTPGDGLRRMHAVGVIDFVNPDGWGLFRGRDRVAGFRPHAFSRLPDPTSAWEVETVELVGLLLHPEPVVYVSAKLPAMDQLRGAPTRPPDEFEAAGLAKLRAGQDHHAAGTADRLRLVGSLRNGRTCVTCHGGEVGDLLGAFSYTLRAAGGR